jgi:hypothetical protein
MLFQPPQEELSDAEIAAILRQAVAGAGGSRAARTFFWPGCAPSTCGKQRGCPSLD